MLGEQPQTRAQAQEGFAAVTIVRTRTCNGPALGHRAKLSPLVAESEVSEEVAPANTQRLRNSQKCMEAYPLLTPFNLAHVHGMQLSLFRQLLLAHASLCAVSADCGPESFELLSRTQHSP